MIDWMTLLPAHPAPYFPVADASLHELPLFVAVGTALDTLTFSGPEAAKFLQGQLTCDLNEITGGGVRLGAHCNPKGRAQSTFLAWADSDTPADIQTINLLLPSGMAAPTHEQLKKFALFSKVTIQATPAAQAVAAGATVALLVGGRDAARWLESQGLPTGQPVLQLSTPASGLRAAALDDSQRLFLLITHAETLPALLGHLPVHTPVSAQNGWWQCLTALGQVHVVPVTQESFIPQELNYDLIHGVSFKKGCYKGQEIIARLHFKGTPKFRTLRLAWQSDTPPLAGTVLNGSDGQRVGQIAQSVQTGNNTCEVLLVARPDAIHEHDTLFTESGDAVQVARLPLPCEIP